MILDGAYGTNELVSIHASNVVIADLTLKRAYDHPIHISGPSGQPITGVTIHNVRVTDPGQQAIKINPVSNGYADLGTVECSLIELTDTGRSQVRGCYTGGIDAHQAWGWSIRRNRIEGFWCPEGLSEHGVHFWSSSRDTVVRRERHRGLCAWHRFRSRLDRQPVATIQTTPIPASTMSATTTE